MSSRTISGGPNLYPTLDRTSVLRALVPAERRRVLSVVLDSSAPIVERTLAARVLADERETTVQWVPDEEVEDAHARLRQVHLPALEDAGLVTWSEAEALVTPTGHPGLRDPLVLRFLRGSEPDDVIEALADRRRRVAVAVLQAEPGAVSEAMLAREVAARTPDLATSLEDVSVSLRHVHLPKLDAAGLVEYDRGDSIVAYHGHPALEGSWFGWSNDETRAPRSPPGPPEDTENNESD